MKATGIVRKIDDLGRIVIPKELRKQIFGEQWAEGKPMEFLMDGNDIVLRRYPDNEDFVRIKNNDENCNDVENAYNKGLNDCWNLTNQLFLSEAYGGLSLKTIYSIFGTDHSADILKTHTPEEALAKIEAYNKKQNEIKVGDIVTNDLHITKILVTEINGSYFNGIKVTPTDECGKIGGVYTLMPINQYHKTGTSFDIIKALNNLV